MAGLGWSYESLLLGGLFSFVLVFLRYLVLRWRIFYSSWSAVCCLLMISNFLLLAVRCCSCSCRSHSTAEQKILYHRDTSFPCCFCSASLLVIPFVRWLLHAGKCPYHALHRSAPPAVPLHLVPPIPCLVLGCTFGSPVHSRRIGDGGRHCAAGILQLSVR